MLGMLPQDSDKAKWVESLTTLRQRYEGLRDKVSAVNTHY